MRSWLACERLLQMDCVFVSLERKTSASHLVNEDVRPRGFCWDQDQHFICKGKGKWEMGNGQAKHLVLVVPDTRQALTSRMTMLVEYFNVGSWGEEMRWGITYVFVGLGFNTFWGPQTGDLCTVNCRACKKACRPRPSLRVGQTAKSLYNKYTYRSWSILLSLFEPRTCQVATAQSNLLKPFRNIFILSTKCIQIGAIVGM